MTELSLAAPDPVVRAAAHVSPPALALSYGLSATRRRWRGLIAPALTVATGAALLVLVAALMPAVRAQGKAFGDAAAIGRAAVTVSVLVLVVGALEVAITATRSVSSRSRELGVLGSFGVAPRSVVLALMVEPVVTSVIGGALGSVVGGVTAVMASVTGWVDASVAGPTLLEAVLTATAVSALAATAASALPSRRAAHRPPLQSLTR